MRPLKEWMDGDDFFNPLSFLRATSSVAELAAILAVVWPEFVTYRGCVFLAWKFDEANADTWFEELDGRTAEIEAVVNHVHLWDGFSAQEAEDRAALPALAVTIRQLWESAVRKAFPDRRFEVLLADEPDDYGPTLTLRSRA